ncbi:phage virion morphogenesis protein [Cupriavidus gilardii]|uniref:phage virion morphogenesis protein n=1 Tax=Cupriavidus gilardii TaxID=82541 RepID=UPI0021BF77DB|nr:phage virion morphogenesis protein [Cupriavidus gilardii]MCT9014614.1 phage virion morphogenesis protein [Cupriavidus gilardii]MCT9054334.1 phage virion morphogenesis protein [Cupriavidus gilardii]
MNGVSLRWQFDDETLRAYLERLSQEQFVRVRQDVGEYMVGQIQDRFDEQRLWDGSAMSQSKAAIARQGQTLIENRLLYQSYVYQLVSKGVTVGSNLAYAAIHHFGGDTGRGHRTHIEARPVLGVNDLDERIIGNKLVNALKDMQ